MIFCENPEKKLVFFERIWYTVFRISVIERKKRMKFLSIISNLLFDVSNVPPEVSDAYQIVAFVFVVAMGVAALAAIVLVMLTPGNSQGIDALGGSSETFYGKNKGKSTEAKLKMWTLICLGVLGVFAITFFILQIPAIWGLAF